MWEKEDFLIPFLRIFSSSCKAQNCLQDQLQAIEVVLQKYVKFLNFPDFLFVGFFGYFDFRIDVNVVSQWNGVKKSWKNKKKQT